MDEENRSPSVDLEFLKLYFDEAELANMSNYEKLRFARIKRNYENLVNIGVNPAVPNFMLRRKRTNGVCVETDSQKRVNFAVPNSVTQKKKTDNAACSGAGPEKRVTFAVPNLVTQKKKQNNTASAGAGPDKNAASASKETSKKKKVPHIDWRSLPWGDGKYDRTVGDQANIDFFLGGVMKNLERLDELRKPEDSCDLKRHKEKEENRRRYPKRNVPKVCYEEEDVSSEDDYIYCDECGQPYNGSCPQHGPLVFVKDKEAAPGPRFAWNTCPDYLSVCRSGIRGAGLGIWTEKDLVRGFVFGPYKGIIVKVRSEAKDSGYAWEIRRSGRVLHYVEGSDTCVSNWMRFVNCAMCEERQNLIAFQYRGQIYYRIYKEIKAYTELLVWYGDEFGKELGIYQNEETLPLEGKIKRSHLDRSMAPSSSMRIGKDSSQAFAQPTMLMSGNHSACNNISSSCMPTNVRECQLLLKSQCIKRVISVLSTQINSEDKLFVDRKEASNLDKMKRDKKLHTLSQCDYTGAYFCPLRNHVDAVRDSKRPYKCQQCDYRASQASRLRIHVDAVHEGLKPYKCQQCEYRASKSHNLRQHVNAVHEGLKPYKCEQCDYRASQASSLRIHVDAVHEGLKPYKCQQCEYRASQPQDLRRHVNAVHAGLKPYKCQQCDYRASQSGVLRRHVDAVH